MRLAVVLGVVALTLTACVQQGQTLATQGETYAVVAAPAEVSMAALMSGRLDIDEHGCYGIDVDLDDPDGGVQPVLWPHGTYLDHTGLNVPGFRSEQPGGIGEGTPLTSGGGQVPADGDQAPCWKSGDEIWVMAEQSAEYGFPDEP